MMNSLDLNLASRPLRNNTLLWAGHSAVALLLLAFSTWNVSSYVHHRAEMKQLGDERDSFEGRMGSLERREAEAQRKVTDHNVPDLHVRAAKARDVINRKALSWTRLFNRMESVLPYSVRMVSIRPVFTDPNRRVSDDSALPEGSVPVSVEGIAKTLDAFLEFERALIFNPNFDRVEPHRFNRTDSGEVNFDLRFLYFPESISEPDAPAVAPEGEPQEIVAGDVGTSGAQMDAEPPVVEASTAEAESTSQPVEVTDETVGVEAGAPAAHGSDPPAEAEPVDVVRPQQDAAAVPTSGSESDASGDPS